MQRFVGEEEKFEGGLNMLKPLQCFIGDLLEDGVTVVQM